MTSPIAVAAPTDCTVVAINVTVGEEVYAGATLAIVEMMKG